MALNSPGPTIVVHSISGTSVVIQFSSLPPGTTQHWLAWGRPGVAPALSGPADVNDRVTITAPSDKFVMASGFSYTAGGLIYGPGPGIAFTTPHNVFPNFAANHDAIQEVLNQLIDKLGVDEFEIYSTIVDTRLADIEADQKNLDVRISELLGAISAARRKFLAP